MALNAKAIVGLLLVTMVVAGVMMAPIPSSDGSVNEPKAIGFPPVMTLKGLGLLPPVGKDVLDKVLDLIKDGKDLL